MGTRGGGGSRGKVGEEVGGAVMREGWGFLGRESK